MATVFGEALNPVSPREAFAGMVIALACSGAVALAVAVPTPIDPPAACVAADAQLRARHQPLRRQGDARTTLLISATVSAARPARARCAGDRPELGLAPYQAIITNLDREAAR